MKKLLILMLALVLCLSVFAACEDNPPKDTTVTVDTAQALKNATAYVKNMYKSFLTENKTGSDFELVSSVKVAGTDYAVTWTVDNDAVKVIAGEGKVTIDVDDKAAADVEYNLTAVVSAADGTKGDPLTFKLVVPSANMKSISDALAAPDGELVTVSGTVTLINTPWDDGYKNISVTIEDEAGNQLYLYRLAAKVEIGDVITVKGTMATYNGARQIAAGATAEITGHVDVTLDYKEVTIPQAIASDDNALVIVKGTVKTIDGPWSDQYNNMSVTIVDEAGNELYIYRLATKVEQGDILTIKGIVGSYNGKKQIAQGATAEITGHTDIEVTYNTISIPDALKAEDGTLVSVKGTVVTIGTPWSDSYGNISVTIEDENGNKLYLYRLATNVKVGDVIVVNGKMDTYNEERQIAQGATAEIVSSTNVPTEYKEVSIPQALTSDDGALVIVKGIVKLTEAWSDQYQNMSVTIVDEAGNELYIYRLTTKVEVGDNITVKGTMATYNHNRQIAQGATAEITGKTDLTVEYPEMTIPEAVAAKDGALVTVKGTVKEIGTAWSSQYNNISVTIVDEAGNELYIYRLATKVEVGDVVTVKGVMATYNDARQIGAGATAEITGYVDMSIAHEHLTIPEILAVDNTVYVFVTGKVTTIHNAWNNKHMTITIADDAGNKLYIYRLATEVKLDDIVTIKGKATIYNEQMQISAGATAQIIGPASPSAVTVPVEGVPYKIFMTHPNTSKNGLDCFLTGKPGNKEYYLETTDKVAESADIYIEVTGGGFHLYLMEGTKKVYLNIRQNGNYVNNLYEATAQTVYTWDSTLKAMVTVVGSDTYTFGMKSNSNYTTIEAKKVTDTSCSFAQLITMAVDGINVPDTLVANTAYQIYMVHPSKKTDCFLTGKPGNKDYYLATDASVANAADFYLEETTGGYYIYFMDGANKTYLNIKKSGNYINNLYGAAAETVYTYDSELKTLVTTIDGTVYTFGMKKTSDYTTVEAKPLTEENAFAQFVIWVGEKPSVPGTSTTPTVEVTGTPAANTAYKAYLNQVTVGKQLFLDGGVSGRYLTMTENTANAIDIIAEAVTGGYKFSATINGVKKYIEVYNNTENKISVQYSDNGSVFSYNTTTFAWETTVDGTAYYLGTYSNFNTVSASKTSYIDASNTRVSQFPLELVTVTGETTGGGTTGGGTTGGGSEGDATGGIVFTFGANGNAAHKDGSDATTYTEESNGFTLTLTKLVKVYKDATDAKGNSALKVGTSKVIGSFEFTVSDTVTSVTIKVANYKAKSSSVTINGTNYTLTGKSDNGEYDSITIDTSVTKTISFASGTSGDKRCMINSIQFSTSTN